MTLKVAYDIWSLAEIRSSLKRTGINRVIEEVRQEIKLREDVELKEVNLCSNDPFLSTFSSLAYISASEEKFNYKYDFCNTLNSRLELFEIYNHFFNSHAPKGFKIPLISSANSLFERMIVKLLAMLQKLDVYQDFRYQEFDVFHSPHLKLPPKNLIGGLPRVLTVYDLIPIIRPEFVTPEHIQYFQEHLRLVDVNSDLVVCISEYTRQEFCEYTKMPLERASVTYLAADSNFYPVTDLKAIDNIRNRYSIPTNNYLLTIAELQPRKNLAHLIDCFFRLLSEQPNLDTCLVLVGSKGWMYDGILEAADVSPKLRSRVIFAGYVSDEDLSAIYSGASAFVFPSLYEGFGLPPLEAMQCGVPVITSNTTSLPEVVGDAGIMVDPKDSDALCQAIFDILTSGILRDELSKKGIERAKKFSWAKCAANTVEVYKKAAIS